MMKISLWIICLSCVSLSGANAQDAESAIEYLEKLNTHHQPVTKKMWRYTKSVTNEHNHRRVKRRRKKLLKELKKAGQQVSELPGYNGSTELRDEVVEYLDINYKVINKDYDKIMDLKKIKEKSYSQMEVYYEAQNKASEKLEDVHARLQKAQEEFAAKHNFELSKERSKRQKRMKQANEMLNYYKNINLIFYKPYYEEKLFLEAYQNKNVKKMQQHKSALLSYAEAGLDTLRGYEGFEGDYSLVNACKEVLRFFKREAANKFDTYTDMVLQEEKYQKMKKSFENKSKSERTKEMVEKYNKAVDEYNNKVKEVKKISQNLQNKRKKELKQWRKTSSQFKDQHVNTGFFDWD